MNTRIISRRYSGVNEDVVRYWKFCGEIAHGFGQFLRQALPFRSSVTPFTSSGADLPP